MRSNFILNKIEGPNYWMLLVFTKLCPFMYTCVYVENTFLKSFSKINKNLEKQKKRKIGHWANKENKFSRKGKTSIFYRSDFFPVESLCLSFPPLFLSLVEWNIFWGKNNPFRLMLSLEHSNQEWPTFLTKKQNWGKILEKYWDTYISTLYRFPYSKIGKKLKFIFLKKYLVNYI